MKRPKRRASEPTHHALLNPDVVQLIAGSGDLFVTTPMLGVCKTWRNVAKQFPRATLKDLLRPSPLVYWRSKFAEKDRRRALNHHDQSVRTAALQSHLATTPPDATLDFFVNIDGGTTTQERLLMLLSMRKSTFRKLSIAPVKKTAMYTIYNKVEAVYTTLKHTGGVWGLMQRRHKDAHGIAHRVVMERCPQREKAIAFIDKGVAEGGELAGLPDDAKAQLRRIAALYF